MHVDWSWAAGIGNQSTGKEGTEILRWRREGGKGLGGRSPEDRIWGKRRAFISIDRRGGGGQREETRSLLKLVHIEISHVSFSGESVLSTMTSLGWGTCQQGLWDPTGLNICYPERTQKDRKSEISYNPENLQHVIILSFGGYRI